MQPISVEKILSPENAAERALLADTDFLAGLLYGKPRPGHPEGQVVYHIKDVLDNIDTLPIPIEYREQLRFIALIHDTFKYKVDQDKPSCGENHHAMIARRFAEHYTSNKAVLDIIELHDEAYNSWGMGNRSGKWEKAKERALKLIKRLGSNIDLYVYFYTCDNSTGDKEPTSYNWFINLVNEYNESK